MIVTIIMIMMMMIMNVLALLNICEYNETKRMIIYTYNIQNIGVLEVI